MKSPKNLSIKIQAAIAVMVGACLFAGCQASDPVFQVKEYLRMLSGESESSPEHLERLTTRNYRESYHPVLNSLPGENIGRFVDLTEQLVKDPAISEYVNLVQWTTTYHTVTESRDNVSVFARIILTEKNEGDYEKALLIDGLPQPLKDVLNDGMELPFVFKLVREGGGWKIDDVTIPRILHPIFNFSMSGAGQET